MDFYFAVAECDLLIVGGVYLQAILDHPTREILPYGLNESHQLYILVTRLLGA